MEIDIRETVARFYDQEPDFIDDVPFYLSLKENPSCRILELGCGTGRVLMPLLKRCAFIHGIDMSESMLEICSKKLGQNQIPSNKAQTTLADIIDFDLHEKFDLIIAPFRVIQNIESDAAMTGLFQCIHRHLAEKGRCILNVFNPNLSRNRIVTDWTEKEERLCWETNFDEYRLVHHELRKTMDPESLVLYPDLIYRLYKDNTLMDTSILNLIMRCWYPDDFLSLIRSHGFSVTRTWGGYRGETFGEGPELVAEFTRKSA